MKVRRGKLFPRIRLFYGNSHEMKEEGQMKHSRGLSLRATSTVAGETFHYLLQHTPKGRRGQL